MIKGKDECIRYVYTNDCILDKHNILCNCGKKQGEGTRYSVLRKWENE